MLTDYLMRNLDEYAIISSLTNLECRKVLVPQILAVR